MALFTESALEQSIMTLFEQQEYTPLNGELLERDTREVLLKSELRSYLQNRYRKDGITFPVWGTFDRITNLNYVKDKNGNVFPELEEMMIDKMVREQMPKSSIEYILRKAGGNTLFGLPQETRKTPLQREIEERGERLYNPSPVEKGIGWGLGAAADFATMGGLGGGVVSGLKFVGADLAVNAVIDTVDAHQRKEVDVPKVIAPGHEQEWIDANSPQEERKEEAPAAVESAPERSEGMEEREKKAEERYRRGIRGERTPQT